LKSEPNNSKLGLYIPLLVPSRPWEILSFFFVEALPMTKRGHDYMFVVVNYFNKMFVLMPRNKTIKGHEATEVFF